jgi:hypothetical protein
MKSIKKFLRTIDIFGIPLTFRYKKNDKYSTSLGGLTIIIFIILAIAFGVYYFIPFVKRQNLSIIYYTMNIPKTEQIKFKDSKAAFAIGFDCQKNGRLKVEDVFKLDAVFANYVKEMDGTYHKDKYPQTTHNCVYEDFYNNYNSSFDYLNLKNYQCLDNNKHIIEGIYADKIFSYFEFSVAAINDTDETFNNIDEYLFENDCKLQLVFTDITIDLSNYKEPIKPFLNSFFIQLNPTLFIKRNVFYMNQYLYDDDSLIAVFNSEEKPEQTKTLFSRYEEYSLYIGLDREITRPADYKNYAKIYMRSDLKKTEIRRTYQKITEFYADASSILVGIYEFLIIIISIINNFYAENSIVKKLFIFKGINNKYFNIKNRHKKINELLSLNGNNNNVVTFSRNNNRLNTNLISTKISMEKIDEKEEESSIKPSSSNRSQESKILFLSRRKSNKIRINKRNNFTKDLMIKNEKNNRKQKRYSIDNQSKNILDNNNIKMNNLKTLGKEDEDNDSKKSKSKKNDKNINYNFSLIEIISSLLFPCLLRGNLKIKNEYYDKATEFLYNKLDIILYVRNMVLFDIINETLLDEEKKNIINFLSRPLLSLDKKENKNIFYQNYYETDFDKFYDGYQELAHKTYKQHKEERLLSYSNQKLKELI